MAAGMRINSYPRKRTRIIPSANSYGNLHIKWSQMDNVHTHL